MSEQLSGALGRGAWPGRGLCWIPRRHARTWNRIAGWRAGTVKDALDEAQIDLGGTKEKVVMIKCRACGKLNEEDSKFCQECGKNL